MTTPHVRKCILCKFKLITMLLYWNAIFTAKLETLCIKNAFVVENEQEGFQVHRDFLDLIQKLQIANFKIL